MAEDANKMLTKQAAEWLTRRQRAALTPQDQRAFDAWLDASPAHAVAYARVEATWERAQRLQASPAALAHPKRRWTSSWWRPAAAAAVLMLVAGGSAWMLMRPSVYSTDVGERRMVALADGSRVELNTASRLRVDFTEQGRDVKLLAGEALFHVAKDPQRPFVVHAGAAAVRAVGTVFNVRLRSQEMVEVTVTEGVVAVDDRAATSSGDGGAPARIQRIEAGKGAMVGPGAVAKVSLDADALQRRTAWRRDLIELRGETLEQAVAEFNRYRTTPLVVGDPRIASIRVGGTFATGESEKFLAALRSGFDVRTVEGEGGQLYLVPAQ